MFARRTKSEEYSKNKSKIQDKQRYMFVKRNFTSKTEERPGYVDVRVDPEDDSVSQLRKVVDKNAPNAKLEHAYYRKLIKQKINYLLGMPFSVNVANNDVYLKAWNDFLNEDTRDTIKNASREAVINALSHCYIHYDQQGKLKLSRFKSIQTVCFWSDDAHTILDAFIRYYEMEVYEGMTTFIMRKVEFFTQEGIYFYVTDKQGNLRPDPDYGAKPQPYMLVSQDEEVQDKITGDAAINKIVKGALWTRLPILTIKYSEDELSLYDIIHTLVDEYNRKSSDTADTLEELKKSTTVVKNYDGENTSDFLSKMSETGVAFVRGDGDLKRIPVSTDSSLYENHMNRLRKNIFEFGGGIDMQNTQISNTSGVALKFIFADLDLDCQDFMGNLKKFFRDMKWFVDTHLYNTTGQDYSAVDISVEFNLNMVVNETEVIDNCIKSEGMLDQDTILHFHPWVTDVLDIKKALKKEKEEAQKEFMQGGYGQPAQAPQQELDAQGNPINKV